MFAFLLNSKNSNNSKNSSKSNSNSKTKNNDSVITELLQLPPHAFLLLSSPQGPQGHSSHQPSLPRQQCGMSTVPLKLIEYSFVYYSIYLRGTTV